MGDGMGQGAGVWGMLICLRFQEPYSSKASVISVSLEVSIISPPKKGSGNPD